MTVVRDLSVDLVEDNLSDLKNDLEQTVSEYGEQLRSKDTHMNLSKLTLPEDGIDYWLAYPDGSAIDSTGMLQDWKKEAPLEKAFASGAVTIMDPYFDKSGTYIFSIAAPISFEGHITSLLVVRLDGYCISRWIADVQYPISQGIGYIIAGDGRNIADSKEENYDWITSMYNAQTLKDKDPESQTVAELERQPLEGNTGRGTYVWEGSTNYLIYAPIPETGWGFITGFYGAPVKDYIKQTVIKSLASSSPFILLILLFLAFVWLYANYNLKKERNYANELLLQKQEIENQAENLRINEERFRVALAQTSNSIFEYDPTTGSITNFYAAKNTTHSLGLKEGPEHYIIPDGTIDPASLVGLRHLFNDTQNGIYDNECVIKVSYSDDSTAWYKISISPLSEQRGHVIGIVEDITKEKQADLDTMTGLLNKNFFKEQVTEYLQNASGSGLSALLMLDIDNFKSVNDKYGHPAGDEVIIRTSRLLKEAFSKDAYIGRVGGDEFCIFCFNLPSRQALDNVLDTFYRHTAQMKYAISVTYSCGIALCTDNITFEEIYQQADNALYQSKIHRKNKYFYYSN